MSYTPAHPTNIYIAYHQSDSEFVMNLVDALEAKGIQVWARDRDAIPGKRVDRQLEEVMEEAKIILFVLSEESVASIKLVEEVNYLQREGKTLIPLRIEPCELPRTLKRKQFIDLHSDLSAGIAKLLRALALKGHNISELKKEVLEILSEGERKLLEKKEAARLKTERVEAKRRNMKNILLGISIVVVGMLAYQTYRYFRKDNEHFNLIETKYNIWGKSDRDTLDLIEARFDQHLLQFRYCRHRGLIGRIQRDNKTFYNDKGTTEPEELARENDSLRSVIDSLINSKIK